MARLILITAFLCINFNSKAQNELSNILLEFSADSVQVSGLNSPIFGTLFYSKEKKNILTRDNNNFTNDRNTLVIKSLIRITKISENYPQKLKLSILLYTSEIIDGKQKRTWLNSQFDIKNQEIKQMVKEVGKQEKYVIADDGLFNEFLIIDSNASGLFAIYSDEISKKSQIKLTMSGLKVSIQDGNELD